MRRLENTVEDKWIFNKLMEAVSGFVASRPNTRIMFCRDTIEYPDLESHELLCNHLAPKIKGRPRGRRKKTVSSDGSSVYHESVDGSETNDSDVSAFSAEKTQAGVLGAQSNSKVRDFAKFRQQKI